MERHQLIILDDFGLQPLDNPNRIALLAIIEDRHNKGSIIVTSCQFNSVGPFGIITLGANV